MVILRRPQAASMARAPPPFGAQKSKVDRPFGHPGRILACAIKLEPQKSRADWTGSHGVRLLLKIRSPLPGTKLFGDTLSAVERPPRHQCAANLVSDGFVVSPYPSWMVESHLWALALANVTQTLQRRSRKVRMRYILFNRLVPVSHPIGDRLPTLMYR